MSFRLIKLTIHNKMFYCDDQNEVERDSSAMERRLLKNLRPGEYKLADTKLPLDFYHSNITVSAIVGKNGSGKSTLLELIYRILNNTGFYLINSLPETHRKHELFYVRGIYATLIFEINGRECYLVIEDQQLEIKIRENKLSFPSVHKFSFEEIKQSVGTLFYTIVTNYSLQAFISSDFASDIIDGRKDSLINDTWIDQLFHKNDGYETPIVLNPYRDKSTVDMQTEKSLTEDRVEALLIYYSKLGIEYISGYQLRDISYTLNSDKTTNAWTDRIGKTLSDDRRKEKVMEMFYLASKSEGSFAYELLSAFGVKSVDKVTNIKCFFKMLSDPQQVAKLYIVNKSIAIASKKYPGLEKFYYLKDQCAIDEKPMDERNITFVREFAEKLKVESHITTKLHRALALANVKLSLASKDMIGSHVDYDTYKVAVYGNEKKYDIAEIAKTLPPPIYEKHILLDKVEAKVVDNKNQSKDKGIDFYKLSSGEKQFIYTTSTIVYHSLNLKSIPDTDERLRYNNICCVFDEVELCFHPEYQRVFIYNLISLLTRTGLADRFSFNMIFATHSPFILSDIPANNILYLQDGVPQDATKFVNPFAANINDILKQSFFLEKGFLGEFAKQKIMSLCHYLRPKDNAFEGESINPWDWGHTDISVFIGLIGEPLLRSQLIELYKESDSVSSQEKIALLEQEIKRLKEKLT